MASGRPNWANTSMSDIREMLARSRENAAKRIQFNKHFLFDVLDAYGVVSVEVTFDGSGDSGSTNDVSLSFGSIYKHENAILSKIVEGVKISEGTQFGPDGMIDIISNDPATVKDLIESICYDALKAEHEGWENNDGAYGEIHFDSENRSIAMNFYERLTEYHEHEF